MTDDESQAYGFVLRLRKGRIRASVKRPEQVAAKFLIGNFNVGTTRDNMVPGTVTWFQGNTRGFKVPGGVELGPKELGTKPGGFWSQLEDDFKKSMRIDRQKYFNEDGRRFCDYHVQVGTESIACVLVPVDVPLGETLIRHAFLLSLERTMNVTIVPTDQRNG
jgi:hypothetical protein